MAILERRREIGIMKAIGASDGDVKKLFFAEAGVMGAFGGALGVALGWTIGRLINIGTNVYLKRQDLAPEQIWFVPWWLVGSANSPFAIVVSLVSGCIQRLGPHGLIRCRRLRYEVNFDARTRDSQRFPTAWKAEDPSDGRLLRESAF